jgi:hypothetical protein
VPQAKLRASCSGILNSDKSVCCPSYCGACVQDASCASRPGSAWECCPDTVKQYKDSCTKAKPPCKMTSTSTVAVNVEPAFVLNNAANPQRAVSIAMMPGKPNQNIFDRMRLYDGKVDSVLLYQSVQYLSWDYIQSNLDAGLKVQLVLEFFDSYPNLWDIANGKYDGKMVEMLDKIRKDGRPLTIRPLHEFNGKSL